VRKLTSLVLSATLACALSAAAGAQAAPLKHYTLVVLSKPVADQEAAYNEWYTNVHLRDLVKVPGIKSAQRFVINGPDAAKSPYKYMAVYDIWTDDLTKVQAAMKAASASGAMVISPALDKPTSAIFYEELTPKVEAAH